MIKPIDLKDKLNQVSGKHCSPIDIAMLNDQVIRLSYIDGEFHWHEHKNQDELFYILKGKLIIQIKNHPDIILSQGQMVTIPKGISHCPKSIEPTYVLLFEPKSLKTKGD